MGLYKIAVRIESADSSNPRQFLYPLVLLYIYLYEDGPFPFCIFPDFGLMPTLTPCYTEWAHPVTVVVFP